jgi:hypothetical protein
MARVTALILLSAAAMAASLWLFPADSDGAFAAYDGIVYAISAERGESEPSHLFHPLFHAAVATLTPLLRELGVARPGHAAIRVVSGLGAVLTLLLVASAAGPRRWVAGTGFAAALLVTRAFLVDAAVGETVLPACAAALAAIAAASRSPVRPVRVWVPLVLALLLRADSILVVPGVVAALLAARDPARGIRPIMVGLAGAGIVTLGGYFFFWAIQTLGSVPLADWAGSYPAIVRNWMGPEALAASGFVKHADAASAAVVGKTWPPDQPNLWLGPAAVAGLVAAGVLLRGTSRIGPLVWAVSVTIVVRGLFFSWFDAGNPEWAILTLALAALLGARLAAGEPRRSPAARLAGAVLLVLLIAGPLAAHAAFTWRLRERGFIEAMTHAVGEGEGARVVALGPNVHNALKFLRVDHTLLPVEPGSPEALPAVLAELVARAEPTLIVFERRTSWMVADVPYLMAHAPPPGLAIDALESTPERRVIRWNGYTFAFREAPSSRPK